MHIVMFPVLVLALVQFNRQYRAEVFVLEMFHTERPNLAKHLCLRVPVFVDSVDFAEIEALRYENGLHADDLTAVHFVDRS
ncbi:hypothetical protein [Mycobacterium lepromatosis]|uniref:hypothetical protein n=1 Tax=Mycobacterium lepromatosis TaxID=480418 RepID=UPI0005F8495C|nr:hypothetical protein [Mycobacterium lepromatosis]